MQDPSSTGPVRSQGGGTSFSQANQANIHNEYNQTLIRQELNVSLDPMLVAKANQAVQESRDAIISQAQMVLDQPRDQMRDEAIQAVTHAQE